MLNNFLILTKQINIQVKFDAKYKWLQHTLLQALRRLDFPTFGRPTIAICKNLNQNITIKSLQERQIPNA